MIVWTVPGTLVVRQRGEGVATVLSGPPIETWNSGGGVGEQVSGWCWLLYE